MLLWPSKSEIWCRGVGSGAGEELRKGFGWFDVGCTRVCVSSRSLRAATSIHHHPRDLAVNDLLLVIEVEHVNGGHLGRGTAGPCRASGVGVLHQVGVRVFLHEHVLALAGAVVGFVAFGGNDPVPAERLEVHSQRVAAAAGLGGVLVAVQAEVSPRTFGRLKNLHFQERQPLLSGSQRGNSQVIAALIKGVDVDSPVGVGLFEPVLQHVLKVNALPVADPGVELYLQGADADVAAALLRDGLQPQDLQVDGGGLLQRPQIHPQLGLQHLGEHQFGAELEEAAAGLPIHLHQGLRLRGHSDH